MSITDGERAMVRRLMTSRSDADVGPLVELGTRCLDVAVEVSRSYDIVEAFARSPRTMVHPPDLRSGDASTDPPTDGSWSRPVGHPVYRGIR